MLRSVMQTRILAECPGIRVSTSRPREVQCLQDVFEPVKIQRRVLSSEKIWGNHVPALLRYGC